MDIFNTTEIYNTIFFNIQSVTEYGSIDDFKKEEPEKFNTWLRMAKKRYKEWFVDDKIEPKDLNTLYLEKAFFLPEFSKIVAISYATLTIDNNGKQKRNIEIVRKETEIELIKEFCATLQMAFSITHNAKQPPHTLCGHNIIGHDIPLFVKRIIKHREELKGDDVVNVIPKLMKLYLNAKPWDSNVLDTINVWKFNGSEFISLNLVAEHMGLKKHIRLLSKEDINKLYWTSIEDDSGSMMEEINKQSANFTNVTLQLVNELRQL